MRKNIRRRYDAHVRVNGVCTEHNNLFDATPGGQSTRAALGTCIADSDRLFAAQTQAIEERRAGAQQSRMARSALLDATRAVVNVGKLVNIGDSPMFTMRVPVGPSDDELIAYARGLLNRVTAHADAFVAAGLPPDLLKNLESRIQGLVAAKDAVAAAHQRFAAAAVSLQQTQSQADKTVAALTSIAVNTPAAHPEVITKLRIARRVGPRTGRPADDTPTPNPAPAPAPPSTTPSNKAA